MSGFPIACNLSALTAEQRQRHAVITAQLSQAVQEVQELPAGYAFRYVTDESTWMVVAEWVNLERRCCPFLIFTLIYEAGGPVWLRLTGQAGVKQFIVDQMQHG
jgi:hypothetical protein